MTELRCGNCNHWIGEASEELIYVDHVAKGSDSPVARPRDLRLCKSCNRVSVFVSKSILDSRLARAL